jgi:hypothetical protein
MSDEDPATPRVHAGGCQCGAVRYELTGPLRGSSVCHCRMCQRATGGLFAPLVGAPADRARFTRGAPAFYASSNKATRGFCSDCGTPLTFRYEIPGATFYVMIGTLDDPSAAPIERQFGTESRIPWVSFCEDVSGEETGADPQGAALLADLVSHQGTA